MLQFEPHAVGGDLAALRGGVRLPGGEEGRHQPVLQAREPHSASPPKSRSDPIPPSRATPASRALSLQLARRRSGSSRLGRLLLGADPTALGRRRLLLGLLFSCMCSTDDEMYLRHGDLLSVLHLRGPCSGSFLLGDKT